jgi:hypothetical protein
MGSSFGEYGSSSTKEGIGVMGEGFEHQDGQGGYVNITRYHPLFNELNRDVRTGFPLNMNERFLQSWTFDGWGSQPDDEDGRGGFPATRFFRTGFNGVFRARENPRFFLPGL